MIRGGWLPEWNAPKFAKTREKEEILDFIRKAGRPVQNKELKERFKKCGSTISAHCWELVKSGDLYVYAYGFFTTNPPEALK